MSSRTTARIFGAAAFCIVVGLIGRALESSHHVAGKQAYLAEQAARFDKYYANMHPLSHFVGAGIVVGLALIGTYELLSFGIYVLIRHKPDKG